MLEPIEIDEIGWNSVPGLTDDEAAELHASYGARLRRVTVRKEPGAAAWRVEGRGYAGAVTLSNGRTIRIRTKVEIGSLLHMLAYARGTHDFFLPESRFDKAEEPFEVIVREFVSETAELLRHGLHQGYVEEEADDLTAVRGRLLVPRQLRRNFVRRDRFACRYVDFTPDLTMNRALKLATFLASHLDYRDASLRDHLERNLRLYGGVSLVSLEPQAAVRVSLDRLTERYRVPLILAALIIGSVTLQDKVGSTPFSSYLIDMKELFQQFVAEALRDRLAGSGIAVLAQEQHDLDASGRLEYRTDIELRRGRRCLVVADVKYKVYEGRPAPEDRYQAIAYTLDLDAEKVVLLYPQEVRDFFPRVAGKVDIHVDGLDLSGSPALLDEKVQALVDRLLVGLDLPTSVPLAS